MVLIALPPDPLDATGFERDLRRIAARFAGQCFLGAAPRYDGQDQERLDRLAEISQATGLPKVAVGDVLMHRSNRRPLADVLTCIREGCTIDSIGDRRLAAAAHPVAVGFGAPAAYAFTLLHGAGNGILTIAKGTLPLALFGPAGYGRRIGWLNAPARILQAAAPLIFGAALTAWGLHAIWLTAAVGLLATIALLVLRRT